MREGKATKTMKDGLGVKGEWVARIKALHEALPPTYRPTGSYVPEAHYSRNDGHKHIKSKGQRC